MKSTDRACAALGRMFDEPDFDEYFARMNESGSAVGDPLSEAFRNKDVDAIPGALLELFPVSDHVHQLLRMIDGPVGNFLQLRDFCAALEGENTAFNGHLRNALEESTSSSSS